MYIVVGGPSFFLSGNGTTDVSVRWVGPLR